MSEAPLVSVVMPFLDSARFIAESVASVRTQTYPHWELLLCDDGSTDGSAELALRLAELDPERIRVLGHPGGGTRGASAARNLGIRAARGAYIALLDADDLWLPHKLAEQVALLERTPEADVLVGATEFWYGWTGRPEDARRDHVVRIGMSCGTLVRPPRFLAHMIRGTVAVPCTCSLVARREAVLRSGGFEESFREVYTDQAFYAKLFLASSVLIVDTQWDRYRIHESSSCVRTERAGGMLDVRRRYLEWLDRYLSARPGVSPGVRRALARAKWEARHPATARTLAGIRRGARWLLRRARAVLPGSLPGRRPLTSDQ